MLALPFWNQPGLAQTPALNLDQLIEQEFQAKGAEQHAEDLLDAFTGPRPLPVAVEKLTGRDDSYDIGFSGAVGSLVIRRDENRIYISELFEFGGKVVVNLGIYNISKLTRYSKSFDFECTDSQTGLLWKGKAWLDDSNRLRFEMILTINPRRWVNIGKHGRRFLREKNLNQLNIGG